MYQPEKLKARRKELKMTQKDIADQLGITYQAYSAWERGIKQPSREKIKLLEEFITYVKTNGEMFDILLSKNSDTDFRIRLMSVAMKKVMAEKYEPNIKEGDKKYVYCMIIMGAISTISLWIKSNYDKSVEDVANLMYNLVLYGLKGIEEEKNMSV